MYIYIIIWYIIGVDERATGRITLPTDPAVPETLETPGTQRRIR
jgi:hypothetical protein